MKLSENSKIIETLKRVLKDYDYLKYDENRSNGDVLSVKVTASNTAHDFECYENIRKELEKTTNQSFFIPDSTYSEENYCGKAEDYFALKPRITSNPDLCGGRPCVRGMRIRVTDVLDLLANGLSFNEILEEMPDLSYDDIVACLKFASREIDPPVIRKTDHPVITV